MNFAHWSLMAGLAAVAIPLVLHLLGRRQPQLVDFPALRFVRQTQLEQSASWQLRHMLLLLLRALLLAVLVFALARPRVHSALLGSMIGVAGLVVLAALASLVAAVAWASRRPVAVWTIALVIAVALWGGAAWWAFRSVTRGPALPAADNSAPVAMALIIDTSPSMAYQSENQSRLEAAKEMAGWLLDRVPSDSHVGVVAGAPLSSLAQSPKLASNQVQLIQSVTERVDLPSRVQTALQLVLADELERKEIYLLTDLNSAAWQSIQPELARLIERHRDQVLIQIVDVGVPEPVNWQMGDPEVDFPTLPVGSDLSVRLPITQATGGTSGRSLVTVELWQQAIDPRLPVISGGRLQAPDGKVVDRQVVELSGDATHLVELTAKHLSEGVHHFAMRLDKSDPLPLDNQRYLSVTAVRQRPVLVVAEDPEIRRLLRLVVDPSESTDEQGDRLVSAIAPAQLSQAVLTRFAAIILYDPPSLAAPIVQSLVEHTQGGGGLMLILGAALESLANETDSIALAELLPGRGLRVRSRASSDRSKFWEPVAVTHPIYRELEVPASDIAWQLMPIFRSWSFDQLKPDVQVLAALSGEQWPLFTAQPLGRGQIFTLTTPVPEIEQPRRTPWNELWIADQYWWAFGILSASIRTLSGADQSAITFRAGELIRLSNDSSQWPSRWELYTPQPERVSAQAVEGLLSLGPFSQPGTYYLRGTMGVPVTRGFSVNIPAADTALRPVEPSRLDECLGAGNYHIARGRDDVESSVGRARYGQELYPLLMLFVAGLFLAEQLMSNRFYKIKLQLAGGRR